VKPISAAEARAKIAKFPPELRAGVELIAFSMCDEGISLGLVGAARNQNPFWPKPIEKPKGKAR